MHERRRAMEVSARQAATTREGSVGLEKDAIGLRQVLFQSITQMAPGASVVFGIGIIILYSGAASPFSLLIAFVGGIFVAVSMGQLATRIPSAGGFYSYTSAALGKWIGYLQGWMYSPMYFLFICANTLSWGLISRDFLDRYFNVTPPIWLMIVLLVATVTLLAFLGIRTSTNVTVVLGIAEVSILLVIALLLIIDAGAANTLSAFDPGRASGTNPSHFSAIFIGVAYAYGLLLGFESAIPLSEETRAPRRNVPRAVVLATVAIGLFYVFALYAAVVAWPKPLPHFFVSADPWRAMANSQLGSFFGFMVLVAILNSLFAVTQAGFNSQSRVLFAAGRARVAPSVLARLHPKYGTPYVALGAIAAAALVADLVASMVFDGAFPAFFFFLTLAVIIYLIQYLVVVLACMAFFATKGREDFNFGLHVAAPILGAAVLGPALWYSMKGLVYPSNWAIPVVIIWAGLGVAALVVMRLRGAELGAEEARLAAAVHGGTVEDEAQL
jgi:amino acid transporter